MRFVLACSLLGVFVLNLRAADTRQIRLESGALPARARQERKTGPDGLPTPLAADLEAVRRQMGLLPADPAYYLVRLRGSRVSGAREQIIENGGDILKYVQFYCFIVKMDGAALDRVAAMDAVEWIGLYEPEHRIAESLQKRLQRDAMAVAEPAERGPEHPGRGFRSDGFPGEVRKRQEALRDAPIDQDAGPPDRLTLDLYLFSGEAIEPVVDFVERLGGIVRDKVANERIRKVRVEIGVDRIRDLATLPSVRIIYEYVPAKTLNDVGAQIMEAPGVWDTHGLTGLGQVVGHVDTGLDSGVMGLDMQADFRGRIRAAFALGRANDWSDPSGHGTHTAGSILGSGTNSAGQYKGVAYEAELVHQSVGDAGGGLGGIPSDDGDLFEQAYNQDARLHSNSWGANVNGAYGRSVELDHWTWNGGEPKDMLIVFAAGNTGPGGGTVYSPGTAKNTLTVGASKTDRPELGSEGDNPNSIATFSSRGPTVDGRIKPDLVAPGTWIVAQRTQGAHTPFQADMESGAPGWSEEGPSGPAATPWTLNDGDSRSPSHSWRYAASGVFDDFLVSPAIAIPGGLPGPLYAVFRWKGALGASTQLGIAHRSPGGAWVFPASYTSGSVARGDWTELSWRIPSNLTGTTREFAVDIYGPSSGSSADIRVDDFELTTFSDYWRHLGDTALATPGDDLDTYYVLSGGTSMATPLAAGAATLVRQYFQEVRGMSSPSAALLKATLINGAINLTPDTPRPDNNQGWGRIDLQNTLFPTHPRTLLAYDVSDGIVEGDVQDINFSVTDSAEELRATLVWTDPPGATLQNDLDLRLVSPEGAVISRLDRVNNVEGIDIPAPATGRWLLQVSGETLSQGSQPYAVIVSGAVEQGDGLDAPSDFLASASGSSQGDLSWTPNAAGDGVMIAFGVADDFAAPVDGLSYPVGSTLGGGTVIYNGSGSIFSHANLAAGLLYDYRAWSVNAASAYSAPAFQSLALGLSTGSASATYSGGDIPTDRDFNGLPGESGCPAELAVSVPEGVEISWVDVEYKMTALNNAWKSEQRSWLRCISEGGSGEPTIASGTGSTQGTFTYARSGLGIANGVSGGGDILFELHAGRIWGGSGCDTIYNKVDNHTWTVAVHYNLSKTRLTLPGLAISNKLYDAGTLASVASFGALDGVESGDDVSLDASGVTASFDGVQAGSGRTVFVTGLSLTGANAGQYAILDHYAAADISAKPLTLDALAVADKKYDGSTDALVIAFGTLAGIVGGDDVTLNTDLAVASFDTPEVGTDKTVTVTGLSLEGADAHNYVIGSPTTTASITPGVHYVRTVLGVGGAMDPPGVEATEPFPSREIEVAHGDPVSISYSAQTWHLIDRLYSDGVEIPAAAGQTNFTWSVVSVTGDVSNQVAFAEEIWLGDNLSPLWWADARGYADGTALSVYGGYLLNQTNLNLPFEILAIGIDDTRKPYLKWLSSGPSHGWVSGFSTTNLLDAQSWKASPGETVHVGGTNIWTALQAAPSNAFYYVTVSAED